MRILAISDFGHTGISESLMAPLHHWHRQGHEIWQLALGFNGWVGAVKQDEYPWRDRLLRMINMDERDKFGQNCIGRVLTMVQPDIVITAFDVWMISYLAHPENDPIIAQNPETLRLLHRDTRQFRHIAYFPLDGLVQGKHLPRNMEETICGFDVPVTYSQFAQQAVLRDTGIEIPFIPISHDHEVYCPGDRAAAREALNLPQDKFIVGMVATNQYRKLWPEFIEAAARLALHHDDVLVLPFTTWDYQLAGGFDISDLLYRNGITTQAINPGSAVGGLSHEGMANLYRALDVHVLTTVGEGAGLPPIRARACGTPSLVSANTSNVEFAADEFELIPVRGTHVDNGSNIERYTTNVDELHHRLEVLYNDRRYRDELGAKGARIMREQYSNATILPLWDELLRKAGE